MSKVCYPGPMTAEATYAPTQLGERLGTKAGMTRRYHLAYEAVTGEALPRDPINNGRLVNGEQLAILTQAREKVRMTPSLSVEDAIRQVTHTFVPGAPPALPPQHELLAAVVGELRALREQSEAHSREVAELREQLRTLNPSSSSDDAVTTELRAHAADLERRNGYLMGELERRSKLEGEAPRRRPWWRWWRT